MELSVPAVAIWTVTVLAASAAPTLETKVTPVPLSANVCGDEAAYRPLKACREAGSRAGVKVT